MAMSAQQQLKIVLNYKSNVAPGINRDVAALLGLDKTVKRVTSHVDQLNESLGRKGNSFAAPKGIDALNKALGLTAKTTKQNAAQEIQLMRAQTRLRQDGVRLIREETRAKAEASVLGLRTGREEAKLRQDIVRLRQSEARAAGGSELHGVRMLRERSKLQRDLMRRQRDEWGMSDYVDSKSRYRDLAVGGAGVGTLALMRKGVGHAGSLEDALTGVRTAISTVGSDGRVNLGVLNAQMAQAETLGMKLGNRLTGTTGDFLEMMSVLRQNGLDTEAIFRGAGESVANLSVVMGATPRLMAKPFAQFGQQFKLSGGDFSPLADLMARARAATGADPGELIDASKYFAPRAAQQMGLTGLAGADQSIRLLAALRKQGLEGSVAGTQLSNVFEGMLFGTKKQQGIRASLKNKNGVDLDFFDKKGQYKGVENMIAQLEKLRKFGSQERMLLFKDLFGMEGMGAANILMDLGVKGWRDINTQINASLPLHEQIEQKMGTYNAKVEAALGTLENLSATTFTPMLNTLKPVIDSINSIAGLGQEYAKANPGAAKFATRLAGVAGVTLTTVAGFNALTSAFKVWRTVSTVGASEQALLGFLRSTRTEALSTASAVGGVNTATKGVGRLSGAVSSVMPLAKALAVGVVIDQLIQVKGEIDRRSGELETLAARSKELFGDYSIGKPYSEALEKDPRGGPRRDTAQGVAASVAADVGKAFNNNKDLEYALGGYNLKYVFRNFLWGGSGYDDPNAPFDFYTEAAARKRQQGLGGRLLYPENMKEYIRQTRSGSMYPDIPQADRERHLKTLENDPYFAGSYKQAIAELNLEIDAFSGKVKTFDIYSLLSGETIPTGLAGSQQPIIDLFNKFNNLPVFQSLQITTDAITGIAKPAQEITTALGQFKDPLLRMPGAIKNAGDAASSFATKVNSLEIKSPSFGPFPAPPPPPLPAAPNTGGPLKSLLPSGFPSKAAGGIVRRSGLVEVHEREAIVPASVTDRWRDSEFGKPDYSAFSNSASQTSSAKSSTITFTGGINISVPAGSAAAEDPAALAQFVASEVKRQVSEATARLDDPRYISSMVAYELNRESGLS